MKPSELKKATNVRLDIILNAIRSLQRAINNMSEISWSDRRTLELWEGQVRKAKKLKEVETWQQETLTK